MKPHDTLTVVDPANRYAVTDGDLVFFHLARPDHAVFEAARTEKANTMSFGKGPYQRVVDDIILELVKVVVGEWSGWADREHLRSNPSHPFSFDLVSTPFRLEVNETIQRLGH